MIPDEDLFRAWQQHDAGALTALVQRHHAPLLAHLTRLIGDVHLAEDLVQETFLRLVREGHTYRYPSPFLPWLYTIARHLAHNYWRSAYARRVETRRDWPEVVEQASGPVEWLVEWEQRQDMQSALATLTFEQREVLSLRFGQEFSVEATAHVLGLPSGTVKSRTFTALRRLRAALTDTQSASDSERRGHSHEERSLF